MINQIPTKDKKPEERKEKKRKKKREKSRHFLLIPAMPYNFDNM
jgi:hypothetical protein